MKTIEVGVYVHMPFCLSKCPYCDFNSYANRTELRDAYVEALCREISLVVEQSRERSEEYLARTLYFGGGTPTLLAPAHLERILSAAAREIGWHPGLETSVEANPGTVDVALVRHLRSLGINRVSLGAQSLDDAALRGLGRIHNAAQAMQAFEDCRLGGIENVNVDLIYGLPRSAVYQWRQTLERAIALAPNHLSLYPLTVEPNTPFHSRLERGDLAVPTDDEVAEMYELAEDMLAEAGYDHYEISNWARAARNDEGERDYRCQHNLIYWRNEPYVGLGAGAHSSLRSRRFHNALSPEDYVSSIARGTLPIAFSEAIDRKLEMAETAILRLRLSEGIARSSFRERFGEELDGAFGRRMQDAIGHGLVADDGETMALTSRGRLLANEVFIAILGKNL
ncbi:MAG: radical SAM family heme chaperone HemW [Chloroflexi bacterium]|nr:radical SAM family heme chaperone HemW [Chloroflexota bacterium]